MERFEYSITRLEELLKTSKGWLQVSKDRLDIEPDDPKWQEFVEKYQAEVDDIESAIAHLKHLRDYNLHLVEQETGENGVIINTETGERILY